MSNSINPCNHPTPNGPCNMPKGHSATFHRCRTYKPGINWKITDKTTKKILKEGKGRMRLGYAITDCLVIAKTLLIEISQ